MLEGVYVYDKGSVYARNLTKWLLKSSLYNMFPNKKY